MRSRGIGYRSLLSDLQRSLELASGYTYNPIISIQYLGVLWTYLYENSLRNYRNIIVFIMIEGLAPNMRKKMTQSPKD